MMENIFTPKPQGQPKEELPIAANEPVTPPNKVQETRTNGKYEAINVIDLVNVRQEYDKGNIVVFDNLNLSIPDVSGKGQFITIMGQSGCGKSTILRYISNLNKPTSGQILYYGKPREDNLTIPMVFQKYSSFYWDSVLDNVALPLILAGMPKKEARERAQQTINIVGLQGHENKWAKYPTLSGGQLQRVAIARSLVANPNIILMDEPFGALDVVIRHQMQMFIRQIFEEDNGFDHTVILVTHDIREAVFLSTNIILLGGKPAAVAHNIEIDLPDHRDKTVKRSQKYLDYVDYIDDLMNEPNT